VERRWCFLLGCVGLDAALASSHQSQSGVEPPHSKQRRHILIFVGKEKTLTQGNSCLRRLDKEIEATPTGVEGQ
jgi:hypothetical protein